MAKNSKKGAPAFSVQQPFAEQILQGVKLFEYRTVPTHRRGRVFIYASRTIYRDPLEWQKLATPLTRISIGCIVGTVEIVGCDWSHELNRYRWHLADPRRLPARPPDAHPQPVWFYPFTQRHARQSPVPIPPGYLPFHPPTSG